MLVVENRFTQILLFLSNSKCGCTLLDNCMKFRHFILLSENDPLGGAGAAPGAPAADPMAAGAPSMPPAGAPPMGAPPGGDPMMGGGMPPPGGMAPSSEPPVIPKHADVWDVLDHILNKRPLEHDKQLKQQKDQKDQPDPNAMGAGAPPPMDPSQMGGGQALMM